ncbi:MAG: hypothetical protein ACXAE3_01470 [Candidatus Kariarchaeaceae archaeon]|jgi:hypothetical protein
MELKNITEENLHNKAYQLLTEVYVEEPSEEQIDLLGGLFQSWFERARSNLLHHAFEILESHESEIIRELVLQRLETYYPDKDKSDILELWITHPLPIMREFAQNTVDTLNLDTPVRAAIYVMLDEIDKLMEIDPDFHYLDSYLNTVDPLLGSLLIQKVEQLKNPELNMTLPNEEETEEVSLMDRIRKRDFAYLWENILDYPLPFVAELMNIFEEEEWKPVDQPGIDLYEILLEQLGDRGWYAIENCKWVVLSRKSGNEFRPMKPTEIERGDFNLIFSQDLVVRPDRIKAQKFKSRGRFALTNADLGLNIYQETVRKSEFDGLLHVPVYSSNGVELVEFTIPVSSDKNFVMDDDGLYFTVRNKEGTYSIDLDALAAFLLPISRHSEMISDMIPVLLERASENQKMPLQALNLLSRMHSGREYSLWDLKKVEEWDDLEDETAVECKCTLAVDMGNALTKVAFVVHGECEHTPQTWEFPTIIYYNSVSDYLIGNEVFEKSLYATSQTFQNIKDSLKLGSRKYLRIRNSIVTSYDAYRDFLLKVISNVEEEMNVKITRVAMTFPVHAPSGFEAWLRSLLLERGIDYIELIDELSASVLGSYRLHNQRGNVMVIDIGSSQITAGVASMDGNKSRKKSEEKRMREDLDSHPTIIAKTSIDMGSREISALMFDLAQVKNKELEQIFFELEVTKNRLASEFEANLLVDEQELEFSMNAGEGIDVSQAFEKSELNSAFKLLLRNAMVKANQRGIAKENFDTVLVLGQASQWPPFLEYIHKIFKDQEIIIEDDIHLTAKGVGLLANGQKLDMFLEEDIMLKVAKNGIVGYENIVERGEALLGTSKIFEIRPHSRMDSLVLDCWVRRPIFIADEKVQPMKDGTNTGHTSDSRYLFTYDRLFREIVDLDQESNLKVNISSRGTLYFEIESKSGSTLVNSHSSVY